jgi:hypothetical protein
LVEDKQIDEESHSMMNDSQSIYINYIRLADYAIHDQAYAENCQVYAVEIKKIIKKHEDQQKFLKALKKHIVLTD